MVSFVLVQKYNWFFSNFKGKFYCWNFIIFHCHCILFFIHSSSFTLFCSKLFNFYRKLKKCNNLLFEIKMWAVFYFFIKNLILRLCHHSSFYRCNIYLILFGIFVHQNDVFINLFHFFVLGWYCQTCYSIVGPYFDPTCRSADSIQGRYRHSRISTIQSITRNSCCCWTWWPQQKWRSHPNFIERWR